MPAGSARGFVVAVILVATVAFSFAYFVDVAGRPPRVASKFKGDWKMVSLKDGKPFSLASARGKVIVMNLWATFCPPCVGEMPTFQRLYDQLKNDPNYVFAFVSMDTAPQLAKDFLARSNYSMPFYYPAEEPPALFTSEGLPTTYFIARDGRLAKADVGATEWDAPWVFEDLKKLAAEPAPAN